MMWIVVTVRMDPLDGPVVGARGPWDLQSCDRECRRLLADFAYREPWASAHGMFRAYVTQVRDEVVAP